MDWGTAAEGGGHRGHGLGRAAMRGAPRLWVGGTAPVGGAPHLWVGALRPRVGAPLLMPIAGLTKSALNDGVVSQSDSASVNLAVSSLVDQLPNTLQVGVTVDDTKKEIVQLLALLSVLDKF